MDASAAAAGEAETTGAARAVAGHRVTAVPAGAAAVATITGPIRAADRAGYTSTNTACTPGHAPGAGAATAATDTTRARPASSGAATACADATATRGSNLLRRASTCPTVPRGRTTGAAASGIKEVLAVSAGAVRGAARPAVRRANSASTTATRDDECGAALANDGGASTAATTGRPAPTAATKTALAAALEIPPGRRYPRRESTACRA